MKKILLLILMLVMLCTSVWAGSTTFFAYQNFSNANDWFSDSNMLNYGACPTANFGWNSANGGLIGSSAGTSCGALPFTTNFTNTTHTGINVTFWYDASVNAEFGALNVNWSQVANGPLRSRAIFGNIGSDGTDALHKNPDDVSVCSGSPAPNTGMTRMSIIFDASDNNVTLIDENGTVICNATYITGLQTEFGFLFSGVDLRVANWWLSALEAIEYPFDVDSTAPTVTLLTPTDDDHDTATTVNFTFNITDASDIVNCTLYTNNSGSWAQSQTNTSGCAEDETLGIQFSLTEGDTNYSWSVQACDSLGNCGFSSANFSYIVDTATPTTTWTDPLEDNSSIHTANFSIDVDVTDTNLLRANMSVFHPNGSQINEYFFDQINTTTQSFNQVTNFTLEGIYRYRLEYTDDHTIEDFKSTHQIDNHKITVNSGDSYISVELVSLDPMTSLQAFKTKDRVSYTYDLGKDALIPQKRVFRLTSNERLDYRESDYKMHFVGQTMWADFDLPFNAGYSFQRENFNSVLVEVTSKESNLVFNSIGGLNSGAEDVTMQYHITGPNISSFNATAGGQGATITFNSVVNDDIGVDTVFFNVDGVNVSPSNISDVYTYTDTCNANGTLQFINVWANDTMGLTALNATGFNASCEFQEGQEWNRRPTREFTSVGQGIFWSLLIFVWLVLLLASLTIKGPNNQRMFILAVMQGMVGVVVGIGFMQFNFLVGFIVALSSVLIFAGMALEGY